MAEHETCYSCVDCGAVSCAKRDQKNPPFCPTTQLSPEEKEKLLQTYRDDPTLHDMSVCSAEVEGAFYNQLTRVEEIMELAKRLNYHKIGIANCIGLREEARTFARILRAHGFEVYGVTCKVGSLEKTAIGIEEKYTEKSGRVMCDPLLQAQLLNKKHTDLNVVIGLCAGHDSIFFRNSEAYCTTLITKDRVLGHNPAAVLYTSYSYYKKLMQNG